MEYWNVPGYQPPPVAPVAPAPGATQFVGADDYRRKKRIAEQLRASADKGMQSFDPLVQTQGTGNMPGYTQVNYAGILGNALTPWLESKQAEKAGAAEDEASAAKMAALDQLLGNKNLTAADAIRAKEAYDLDVSPAVKDPDAEKSKALAMIAQNPAMAAMYITQGIVTEDEIAAYDERNAKLAQDKRLEELGIYTEKKNIDARYGPKPGETEMQFFQRDPEGYARYAAAKKGEGGGVTQIGTDAEGNPIYGAEKSGLPSGSITSWGTAAREYQDLADRAGVQGAGIQRFLGDLAASNPNLKDKIGQVASSNGFNSIAEILRSPEARNMSSETIRLAVENARLLAPVSNTDFDKLLAVYPTALTDKDAAARFFTELQRQSTGAQERNQNLAAHATAMYSGVIEPGMLPSTFKRKVEGAKAKADPDEQKYWDDLSYDEKYEIARRTGAFR
jgi:hypothetical protein